MILKKGKSTKSKTLKRTRRFRKVFNPNRRFITDVARIRSVVNADISIVAGTDTAAAYYFQPQQCLDFNQYMALYEQWRLHHVVITWIPSISETNQSFITKNIMAFRWNPQNNITGVPGYGDMRAASNTTFQRVTQKYKKTLYPVAKRQIGWAGVTTYYEDVPCNKIWMQSQASGAAGLIYYGLDWFILDMGITSNAGTFEIEYYLEFKGQK